MSDRRGRGPALLPAVRRCSRAASSSNAAVSSSPRARQASPRSTRTRATSYGTSSSCHALPRPAQREQGSPRVAFGQVDRSLSVRNHRIQHAALVAYRDLLSSLAGAARLLGIAHGEHDLDVGGQEPRAFQGIGRLVHHPADRGGRRVVVPLGQPQQGQTRLRLPARTGSRPGTPPRPRTNSPCRRWTSPWR